MIANMDSELFETTVEGVLVSKEEIDASMRHWFLRWMLEINSHQYVFDRKEKEAEQLEKWLEWKNKSDLIKKLQNLFHEVFIEKKRILSVIYTCINH